MKILFLLIITAALALGATTFKQTNVKDGRFKQLAKEAKEKGETQVTTASFTHTEYVGQLESLDSLLQNYSFIVAELVEQKSYVLPSFEEVVTWSKFRTLDTLSRADVVDTSNITPPAELLTLNPDEFLIAQVGGNISIEGVTVRVEDKSFPLLKAGKKYLLIMSKNKSGVAILAGGPAGVFMTNDHGVITPLVKQMRSFQTPLVDNLGQSLKDIKSSISSRRTQVR